MISNSRLLRMILLLLFFSAASHAQVPDLNKQAVEQRVESLLSRLTAEQKIDLIGGDEFYIRAIPEIGFPRLKMSDGPMGIKTWWPANAYAGGVALAATWDPDLAKEVGKKIGEDSRAHGVHFLLGPGVNLARAPMAGRDFEYFGEDPWLAARLAVSYIQGIQSQGVIATVKHFAANNQEYSRHDVSSDIDERTLRELYLPAFEAAVKEGHVGAIMDSYNPINGVHASQNNHLNNEIAKQEWGFDGIIMSDWVATYDGVAAARGGLDLEMPTARFMNKKNLLPALKSGALSQAVIDDKVRRILRKSVEFGFLDREQLDMTIPPTRDDADAVALQSALESAVLLKNEKQALPLDAGTIHTVAVIGPNAWPVVSGGGGSSQVVPISAVSNLAGLSAYGNSRNIKTLYSRGIPGVEELFRTTNFTHSDRPGLLEEEFSGKDTSVSPKGVKAVDHLVTLAGKRLGTQGSVERSIRWSGQYMPTASGDHMFLVICGVQDDCELRVEGHSILHQLPHEIIAPPVVAYTPLVAGKRVSVELLSTTNTKDPIVGLGIRAVSDLIIPEAKRMAAMADAVVLSVGFEPTTEFEGTDRSFDLPPGQEALIRTISPLNKKTIVVLNGGGNMNMEGWLKDVPALIHQWYPGQAGGTALAKILYGEFSPEGKLPVSFEYRWEENPTHDNYYPNAAPLHVEYREGLMLGYRYYTTKHLQPAFPFGFGLSYTQFQFSGLRLDTSHIEKDGSVDASFQIKNIGVRRGADVAQLYLGDSSAHAVRPAMELKGFQKVRLDPGESKTLTFKIDRRAMSYYDTARHDWHVDPGAFKVFVGDSSENTPLKAGFVVPATKQ